MNTFKGHRIKDMKRFYHNLLFYRLLLDYYVVRKDISNGQSRFSINFRDTDAAKREYREQMRQYMSMLTVSTEFHIWLKPYMQYLHGLTDDWKITSQEIIAKLKETDNAYRIQKAIILRISGNSGIRISADIGSGDLTTIFGKEEKTCSTRKTNAL